MKIKNVDVDLISNSRNESAFQITINGIYTGSAGADGSLNRTVKEMPNVSVIFLNKILNKGLYGINVESFKDVLEIEELLMSYDGTKNLSKIGSKFLLALEFALLKAASDNNALRIINKNPKKIPQHLCNCIVTNYTEKSRRFQEFYILPKVKNFSDGLFANSFVYGKLKSLIKGSERTDEGSFITGLKNENVLAVLEKITEETTKKLGVEFSLGINFNSENTFNKGIYKIENRKFKPNDFVEELKKITNKFDVEYIEDPINKDDIANIQKIKSSYISGNRIFNSDFENIKKYAKYFNCAVLKLNEIGSIGKLKKITDFCKNNDMSLVLEQNLGETSETVVSEIAVGFEFDFVKFGLSGKERILKLHEIKRIEAEL